MADERTSCQFMSAHTSNSYQHRLRVLPLNVYCYNSFFFFFSKMIHLAMNKQDIVADFSAGVKYRSQVAGHKP